MFHPDNLNDFYGRHHHLFTRIETLRTRLAARFHDRDEAINSILLATLTDLPCILFGPPGTAKSRLIRDFCTHVGIVETKEAEKREYFEYLLTKFTEPTELFGAFKLADSETGGQILERIEDGMLHKCRVAFLDEVFNGSSAILNALLALINERVFHDKGEIKRSNLSKVFAASNLLPKESELKAVFDRFVIRTYLGNVDRDTEAVGDYLKGALANKQKVPISHIDATLLTDAGNMLEDYEKYEKAPTGQGGLFDFESDDGRNYLTNFSYIMDIAEETRTGSFSNRRVYQMLRCLTMQRLMRASRSKGLDGPILAMEEYEIIWGHFLDVDEPLDPALEDQFRNLPVMPKTAGQGS